MAGASRQSSSEVQLPLAVTGMGGRPVGVRMAPMRLLARSRARSYSARTVESKRCA